MGRSVGEDVVKRNEGGIEGTGLSLWNWRKRNEDQSVHALHLRDRIAIYQGRIARQSP